MKKRLLVLLLVAALLSFTSTAVFAGDDVSPGTNGCVAPVQID